MEIEKQELIVHARETASKALKAITGEPQLRFQSSWFPSLNCAFFCCSFLTLQHFFKKKIQFRPANI